MPSRPPRSVVVVGGSSGIGLALAERLAARGVVLTLVARHAGRLDEAAHRLWTEHGVEVHARVADVTDAAAVAAVVDEAAAAGRLDAVVDTAQAMAYGTVEVVPPEVLGASIADAALGVSHLARSALPAFRAQGHGRLLVVGSLLSQLAVPGMASYCAAKAAQLMLVRALQMETAHEAGIEVSMVSPGAVDTPIYRRAGRYSGPQGSAPPPVAAADTVAAACERALVRPVRNRQVGLVNRPALLGYHLLPAVYDRLAPVLVGRVLRRGPAATDDPGALFEPSPGPASVGDGWTWWGTRRDRAAPPPAHRPGY